jgi:hypothetical protein
MGTQTVKICTSQNLQGQYEKYYRLRPQFALTQQAMSARVQQFQSIFDLEAWLVTDCHAVREAQNEVKGPSPSAAPRSPSPSAPACAQPVISTTEADDDIELMSIESEDVVSEILGIISPSAYSPENDSWLPDAKECVEQAINTLVEEFVQFPYLHRVEHSIHTRLYELLSASHQFSQHYPIGQSLAITQLIHKEWPETIPRESKGNRRGNFDLAVLSPVLLATCAGIDLFLEGRLPAPIVIEIGLDYDVKHLANDAKKLLNSKPKHCYLVHLVRDAPRDPATEQIILGIQAKGIGTAYGRVAGNCKAFKLINQNTITEA